MEKLGTYSDYAQKVLQNLGDENAPGNRVLADAVAHLDIESVLDVGCGVGQELLPFAAKPGIFCCGVDRGAEIGDFGRQFFAARNLSSRVAFARANGENLPFANDSFDIVLCRLALPYMNNQAALDEFARVLRPRGAILLKTHAPPFYFSMIRERAKSFNPKLLAYPLICLAGGFWYQLTDKQPSGNFWHGKEVYQTRKLLARRLRKSGLRIASELVDTNRCAPSFLIVKQ